MTSRSAGTSGPPAQSHQTGAEAGEGAARKDGPAGAAGGAHGHSLTALTASQRTQQSHLVSAWLTSFAIGVVVAVPTAILVAPNAQRLVSRLTGGTPAARVARPGNAR
jgi:hypothetical protein